MRYGMTENVWVIDLRAKAADPAALHKTKISTQYLYKLSCVLLEILMSGNDICSGCS
jgi:hypothetical protein